MTVPGGYDGQSMEVIVEPPPPIPLGAGASQIQATDGSAIYTVDNTLAVASVDILTRTMDGSFDIRPLADCRTYSVDVKYNGTTIVTLNETDQVVTMQYITGIGCIATGEFDTLWKIENGEITSQYALDVVASKMKAGTASTDYISDESGDFTNLQANISWTNDGLFNDLTLGTNWVATSTIGGSLNITNPTSLLTGMPDGGGSEAVVASANYGGVANNYAQIDYGASRVTNVIYLYLEGGSGVYDLPATVEVYSSTDAFAADNNLVGTFAVQNEGVETATTIRMSILLGQDITANSIRFSVVTATAGTTTNQCRFELARTYDATPASTGNYADTNTYTGASATLPPTTLQIKNPQGTLLVDGQATIDYALNAGAFQGSQLSISAFQALSLATFTGITQLDLRVTPIDFNGIGSVRLATPSSEAFFDENGNYQSLANEVVNFSVDNQGNATFNGTISSNVVSVQPYESVAVNTTLDDTHYTVDVDASGAARTITLPAAASNTGRVYNIRKKDSSTNTVTVDGNASETINGETDQVLSTQYTNLTIQSDGANWIIL